MADRINVRINSQPKVLVNQSNLLINKLSDLSDVDLSQKTDGSVLVYDQNNEKWAATKILEKQIINGGNF
jgi:frataxin-like iron-binding protein CyaY